MSQIVKIHYEIVRAGLEISTAHFEECAAAKRAHWQFVDEVGGSGLRPTGHGGLRSVFFKTLPPNWRKIGSRDQLIEAIPSKTSATGKALAKQIAELPQAPEPSILAGKLGYGPNQLVIDGDRGIIYFPTAVELTFPTKRHWLRIPRTLDDGFEPDPAILAECRESEFMRAVEDHNAEARRQQEQAA